MQGIQGYLNQKVETYLLCYRGEKIRLIFLSNFKSKKSGLNFAHIKLHI